MGKAAIRGLLARRDRWVLDAEARGHTPTVHDQLRTVARWAGVRLEVAGLARELDVALLRASVRIAPGGRSAIRTLQRDGVPLALVSNVLNESGDAARAVLDRLGLLPAFRGVILSCEHPWAKPSPEPFRLACRSLGTPPARTVHLGDLDYDLAGAARAGMAAWWYVGLRRWNGYLRGQVDPATVAPESVVRSWSEVVRRFRRR